MDTIEKNQTKSISFRVRKKQKRTVRLNETEIVTGYTSG
jgi:hypothetical protein